MAAPSRWIRWTCPSEDALFGFSTGDVSGWRRAWLQRHLDLCPTCAARLDGWEAATAAYRDYAGIADAGLRDGFRDDDGVERARVARFEARLRREPAPPATTLTATLAWPRQALKPIGWRSAAAAMILVAGGLFGFLPLQETITADALVARAVANDRQCPCPRADMVTIADARPRRGKAHVHAASAPASPDTSRRTSVPDGLMSERGEHARELADRLAEYAFDWQVPLSARPYQAWRSAITARTESYEWLASDRVRVSTHAASGRIARAELILRTTDYRPVGQTWQFSDGFAVELRLFEREAPAAPSAPPPTLNRIAATSGESAASPSRTIEETEIALRVSLERAGVVLTRRLTLRDNGERLTIAGRAARRDMSPIAASAREIGGISVDVRAEAARAAAADLSGGLAEGDAAVGRASTGFDAWLDRTFGASRSRAAFLPNARQLCDELADAVAALDGLSRRFPSSHARGADGRLSTRARDDVRWLTAVYYARVTASYERLEAHLAPLTGSVSRSMLTATPPPQWRTTSAAITPAMRALSAELDLLASSAPSLASPASGTSDAATADGFERAAGASLREKLVAVVPR